MVQSDQGVTLRLLVPPQTHAAIAAMEQVLLALWQMHRKSSWRLWRDHAPISLE